MRLDHVSAAKIEKNPKRKPRKRSVFKAFGLVRVTGLEPACPYEHKNLNLTCLPIPPYPQKEKNSLFLLGESARGGA